ncbi:RDD family protein [bacterium]|nr:RDD family protein [bacterium]
MNPERNPAKASQGWSKNQVNQFSSEELAQKKAPHIVRTAFGHWLDFFKLAITLIAVFIIVQFVLIGVEVLFTDITGISVIRPLEALPDMDVIAAKEVAADTADVAVDSLVAADSLAANDSLAVATPVVDEEDNTEGPIASFIRNAFGVASDEHPEFISVGQFKLVLTINTIIAILACLFFFYFQFVYMLREDGQTPGQRYGQLEILRKDGKEFSISGGIGGIGSGKAWTFALIYLLFAPVFAILTKIQIEYSFGWAFIEGFKNLDAAFAGEFAIMGLVMWLGYWLLAVVMLVVFAFVIGLLFHVFFIVANALAGTISKDEPKKNIAY